MQLNILKNLMDLFAIIFLHHRFYILISLFYIISHAIAPFITIVYFKYLFDAIQFHYGLPYIVNITLLMLACQLIITNAQIYTKSATTLHSKWLLVPLTAMFCKKINRNGL